MTNGTIKRLVPERGFGFISDDNGVEYFFHRNSIEGYDSLRGGESVTFEKEDSPKGARANQVRLVTTAAAVESQA